MGCYSENLLEGGRFRRHAGRTRFLIRSRKASFRRFASRMRSSSLKGRCSSVLISVSSAR